MTVRFEVTNGFSRPSAFAVAVESWFRSVVLYGHAGPVTRLRVAIRPETVELTVSMRVPHRDTGEAVDVHIESEIKTKELAEEKHLERRLEVWLLEQLERAVLHELHECVLVRGVRVFDPHGEAPLS